MHWDAFLQGRKEQISLWVSGLVIPTTLNPVFTAGLTLEGSETARSLCDLERLLKDAKGAQGFVLFVFFLQKEYFIDVFRISYSVVWSYSASTASQVPLHPLSPYLIIIFKTILNLFKISSPTSSMPPPQIHSFFSFNYHCCICPSIHMKTCWVRPLLFGRVCFRAWSLGIG